MLWTSAQKTIEAAVIGVETALYRTVTIPPLHPANLLSVCVESVSVDALVDSGATISVIHRELCFRLQKVQTPHIVCGTNDAPIYPTGQCTARVLIDGIRHHVQLTVLSTCAHQVSSGALIR